MSHKASQAVAQTSARKLARFYSDTTRWAHVGALWVTKALSLSPPVSASVLPSRSQRGLEEPSTARSAPAKLLSKNNRLSSRNHTSTLDKQQAAPLLPANRINLNAHRHSWAKLKPRAETKLHHLMARHLWGSHSTRCSHEKEEKPHPCPSGRHRSRSRAELRDESQPSSAHRPGVTATEGEELSFWSSSSNGKVSSKQSSAVNTTKDSGSAANQLIPEWVCGLLKPQAAVCNTEEKNLHTLQQQSAMKWK